MIEDATVINNCPACGYGPLEPLMALDSVPTNSCLLLDSAEAATGYPTGALRLVLCPACGFITNRAFDAARTTYSTAYEETQGFSPRFRQFAQELASQWIERHGLRDRHVLEIGCGKGEFLVHLSELGDVHGTGIDPAFVPQRSMHDPEKLSFIQDRFDGRYLDLRADAVVCRHTLEHIHDVRGFLADVRRMIGDRPDVPVLFEVPDTVRVLREAAFWDIYYEHCSYFTPGSLARLFRQEGFALTDLWLAYDEQYIIAEALPAAPGVRQEPLSLEDDPQTTAKLAHEFARNHQEDVAKRRARLQSWLDAGDRVVIWGAGSKGVAWLVSLGVTEEIPYAVDINPHKHDKYMAGTGQRIVAPEFMMEYRPDTVVVMNPVYHDEIAAELHRLGVSATLTDA